MAIMKASLGEIIIKGAFTFLAAKSVNTNPKKEQFAAKNRQIIPWILTEFPLEATSLKMFNLNGDNF